MELYNLKDVELIDKEIENIVEQIDKHKLDIFEPTRKEIMDANVVVMEFVKEKKRKIYGGYAQNKTIISKDPNDAFYGDDEIPDIDVYSPEPLKDLIELCNIFLKKGFRGIAGQEALHKETYKIFVNGANVIDLSYVPKNIYNKIPFIEIDGINFVHPSFVYIDLYRMMTEPYFSSFRWKKIFPRLYKLQKHFPFNKASKPLNDAYDVPKNKQKHVEIINKLIYDKIKNNQTLIIVGQYAYNYLLEESGIINDKTLGKKYKLIDLPFMQIISTNYIPDTVNIINSLKESLKENSNKLTYKEFYPLWMFTGYSTVIYYDNFPVLHITSHNNRCIPIRKVEAKYYLNGKVTIDKKDYIQLGSFDFVLLMNLISGLRVRINEIENKYHYHNIMTSHLVEMRNYFLQKQKKTLLDESLFKSFINDCSGQTMDPMREQKLLRDKKYKEGKLVMYRYNPEQPKPAPDFKFANTSGNEINNFRNFKIKKYLDNPKLLEEFIKKTYDETIEDNQSESDSEE
jgi:hypothetical protein